MRKLFLILMTLMACTWGLQAQTRTYHGTVLDASDNSPLVGATVMPIGGGQGVAADVDGNFTLTVPSNVHKANVSYVGYQSEEVNLSEGMVVKLHSSASNLDETIVVAYGTAKKSAYTGSASVVKADEIENTLVTNVTNVLNSKVSGVQMLSSNGQPGEMPSVYIRGTGSLTTNSSLVQPLYVIDGVPSNAGAMLDLSPNDVESMTVLKDAAAAALYGARGANGVILVTTKKGREGKTNITVNANWGATSRETSYYTTITGAAANYQKMYWAIRNYYQLSFKDSTHPNGYSAAEAHNAANGQLSGTPSSNVFGYQVFDSHGQDLFDINGNFNPYATLGYVYGQNYLIPDNWKDELLRHGFRQEYNVSASGGGEKYDFMLAFNYLDDQGIIKNSSFQRMNTRFVGNYQLLKWLKVGANMMYSWQKQNYPGGQTTDGYSDNAFYFADMMAPVYPFYVRNAQGQIQYDAVSGDPLYDYGMPGLGAPNLNRKFSVGNPMSTFVYDVSEYLYDVFDGKWSAIITPVEGLTVSGNIGYYVSNARSNVMYNSQYGQMSLYGGQVTQGADHYRTLNIQALANYNKTWGLNTFDFLVGYESFSLQSDGFSGQGTHLYSNTNNNLSNVSDEKDVAGYKGEYATRGIFGRINYDYDNRIFGSVSYRRDASSRFAPDKRWGNFWSVSAGWDLAKESWMEPASTWLNMLKLRASFGQQGNDNVGNDYAYMDQYAMTGVEGIWNVATLVYKGNPDLTWETSNAFNVGLEFAVLQGKLNGTIEYYSRQTSNMIYNRPVNPSLGYTSIPVNVGSMRNSGVEIELTATPIRTRNVQWDLNFNLTYQQNKIIKLAPELNGLWKNGSYWWEEGKSMYNLYLVKYAGVNPENGLPLYWAKTASGQDVKTENWAHAYQGGKVYDDNDNLIEEYVDNRQETGNIQAPVFGGFGTTVTFFGVDVSIQCGYQLGGRILDYGYQTLMHNGTTPGTAMHTDVLKAWTPENPNTDVPRLDRQWQYMNSLSDRWFTSAKYFAINNISVGYSFPLKWIKKCGLSGLRIYGAADNLAIWSARKGLDPRQSFVQSAQSNYSAVRAISGGVRLTF